METTSGNDELKPSFCEAKVMKFYLINYLDFNTVSIIISLPITNYKT